MRTVSLFKNCRSQAVRIPKEYEFQGISEVTIHREGDSLVLRPVRPTWRSFLDVPRLDDDDFLKERPPVIDEDRFIKELTNNMREFSRVDNLPLENWIS